MKKSIPILVLGLFRIGCSPKNENKPEQPNRQKLATDKNQAFSTEDKEVTGFYNG